MAALMGMIQRIVNALARLLHLFFRQVLRIIATSINAIRYLVSLVIAIVVTAHWALFWAGWIPARFSYAGLANWAGLGRVEFRIALGCCYLAVLLIIGLVWQATLQRSDDFLHTQLGWRRWYRLTDRGGLVWFDLVLLAALVAAARAIGPIIADPYHRDVAYFLLLVAGFPILLDFWPFARPRRAAIPRHGRTLPEVAQNFTAGAASLPAAVQALRLYNNDLVLAADRHVLSLAAGAPPPQAAAEGSAAAATTDHEAVPQETIVENGAALAQEPVMPIGLVVEIPPRM